MNMDVIVNNRNLIDFILYSVSVLLNIMVLCATTLGGGAAILETFGALSTVNSAADCGTLLAAIQKRYLSDSRPAI